MTNINSTTEAPAEIQQALVTLRAVAEWLESSVSYGQSSPEEPPAPQSEFDHRLGQAAAEIANVANSIESAQSRQPSAQGGEPEPVALAFPHSQDFSETKCPDCGKKFYVEREFFPPPAGGGKEALSDAERLDFVLSAIVADEAKIIDILHDEEGFPLSRERMLENIEAAIRAGKKG